MKKIIMLIITATLSSISMGTTLHSMSKDALTAALKNKTISTIPLATLNDKLISNSLTAYFGKQGQIDAKFATPLSSSEPQTDRGLWKVTPEGMLCVTWDSWNQSKPSCVIAYDLEDGLLFVNPQNNNFASLVLKENIKEDNQLQEGTQEVKKANS